MGPGLTSTLFSRNVMLHHNSFISLQKFSFVNNGAETKSIMCCVSMRIDFEALRFKQIFYCIYTDFQL